MGYLKKEISIGFLISIIATVCGVFLYIQYFSKYGFEETIQMIQKGNLYAQVLSLAALPNLFVFFVFITIEVAQHRGCQTNLTYKSFKVTQAIGLD